MFFQSLTNACHAQPPAGERPAHSQTWPAFLLPQAWPWLWAGKLSSWRRNTTGVCSTTSFAREMLLEGTAEQAVPDLSLADHLFVGQGINNSIQLSGHLPLQTTLPPGAGLLWLGPGSPPFGLFVARVAEATALSPPLFRSPTTANSSPHWSLFLNWKYKCSILRNLCDFSPDMTVPA